MRLLNSIKQFNVLPSAFGLDISDSSLKIIQLEPYKKHLKLAIYAERPIPEGVVLEGKIKDSSKLGAIIKDVVKEQKPKGLSPYVVASISDEEVFLKQIQLPRLNPKELTDTLFIEAERNVPISLSDAYLSHVSLPEHDKKEHLDMLIAVARKETVDALSSILSEADLTPAVFEPEVISASRSAIPKELEQKNVLILEIGANRTRLIPVTKGIVALTGIVPFSAKQVSLAISQALGLNDKEANSLVWTQKLLKDKKTGPIYETALSPVIQKLATAINEYISFLKNESGEDKHYRIDRILVSGGGARVPGIEKILSLALELPVSIVDPWVNVMPEEMKDTPILKRGESPRFTVAIGLAIRGIRPTPW